MSVMPEPRWLCVMCVTLIAEPPFLKTMGIVNKSKNIEDFAGVLPHSPSGGARLPNLLELLDD